MSAFQRRMMRDAVALIQAADKEDTDAAAAIMARTEAAAYWTLALIAAEAIAANITVDAFAELTLAQVEQEAADERELGRRIAAVMDPKGGDGA